MKMVYVLVGAVTTAAAIGAVRSFAGSPPPTREPAPMMATAPASHAAERAEPPSNETIAGEVLEVIDVASYTYLRVGAKGSEGQWTAVPTAKLAVGANVRVVNAMKMTDFKSTTLGRTFPVIYFGTIEGSAGDAPRANDADPHGGSAAGTGASAIEVKPVPRAAGPNGKTVAEVNDQRTQLVGKTVRIHGTVVKSNGGIMGKTWIHLRDGSGDAAAGTNDITVTTEATPKAGDVVTIEGVVAIDRDIGAGYKYATLVEDAKIVTP